MTRSTRRSLPARLYGALLAMSIAVGAPTEARAQPVAASTLKAAFMLNFVKFTEWPIREAGLPILVCVSASDEVFDAMTRTVKGQVIDGRMLRVIDIPAGAAVKECQLLFVADRDPRRLAMTLDEASHFAVLTVSDIEQSVNNGIMVELFRENGRMRFAVNIDTITRSPVRISSQLLALAKVARDAPAR